MLRILPFLVVAALPGADLPQWRETTITDSLKMGYQLVAADLNRDGRPDLIAVDERGTELAWYENPTWERHVIIKDVPRTINLDLYDYDGDGIPEIAMGHNFETVPEKSVGNVLILKSGRTHGSPGRRAKSTVFLPYTACVGSILQAMGKKCCSWHP
jgi:VCBS repeat protein